MMPAVRACFLGLLAGHHRVWIVFRSLDPVLVAGLFGGLIAHLTLLTFVGLARTSTGGVLAVQPLGLRLFKLFRLHQELNQGGSRC